RDYPTRPLGLSNLRTDNQRLRSRGRRPSKSGPPVRHRDPTRHTNRLAPTAVAPLGLSNGDPDRLFFGRQKLLSARANRRHPTPARYSAPVQSWLAPQVAVSAA